MEKVTTKKFLGTPFTITTSNIDNGPGVWDSTKVSIYREDLLIGEYIRNYSSGGHKTFYPFLINGQWYALYSARYTATRVMKLNDTDIEDWCGEESSAHGFCPAEMYVPCYHTFNRSLNINGETKEYTSYTLDNEYKNPLDFENEKNETGYAGTKYCDFGFLSGCVWGDDSSWKLRYIDLSKVPEKVLEITDKFGYWELPNGQDLKSCINFSGWEPDHQWVELTRMEHVNLSTGERC
jgi:hypothetical protein